MLNLTYLLLLTMLFTGCTTFFVEDEFCDKTSPDKIFQHLDLLKPGDIIFRREEGITSRAVLYADKNTPFSHVGIVVEQTGKLFVVHAVPGNNFAKPERVHFESVDNYIKTSKAIAVYRLLDKFEKGCADEAASVAYSYFLNFVLFDSAFSLSTTDKLYCTELVWQAYKTVGIDVVNGIFDTVKFPLIKNQVILPSSFLKSPYLNKILLIDLKPI